METNSRFFYFITKDVYLKNVVFTSYSSLPYSVFKTPLNNFFKKIGIKIKVSPFFYKNNIVTLRAPKHFKAGKQQFNKTKRRIIIKLTNYSQYLKKRINYNQNVCSFIKTAHAVANVYNVVPPLTVTKSVATQLSIKLKLKLLTV